MKHHTPHPRILALASVLFSAFMLVGCSDKAALESVDYVLNNAQQEPTEALERIASIDKGSIRGKHNRARYALAYSEALYYNRISSNSDTLVAPMMQYYIHLNDNHLERARALYQYALIKVNEMEYPEALLAISEALKSLDIEEDYKLRGLLHRTEGEIYFTNMLPNNSLESYISAKEYFDKADLPSHSLYTLCQIGTTAIYMRDYEVGESYLLEAKRLAKSLNDKYTLSDILHSLCIKYIQNEEYDKCKTTLEEYHTYDCLLGFHSDYHCFCAIIAFYNRDYQSSQEHIAIAESLVTPDDTLLEHTKYMLALSSEDYERAYDIYSNMVEKQDGAILNAISHPILNKQIDYLAKSLDDEQCKNSLVRQRNTILFITLFLIVILCIVYIYRKKIEYRNTTTSYIDNEYDMVHKFTKTEDADDKFVGDWETIYQDEKGRYVVYHYNFLTPTYGNTYKSVYEDINSAPETTPLLFDFRYTFDDEKIYITAKGSEEVGPTITQYYRIDGTKLYLSGKADGVETMYSNFKEEHNLN